MNKIKRLYEEVKKLKASPRFNYPLGVHTTYGTGGAADLALFPVDAAELGAAVQLLNEAGVGWCTLGGGSNVLVSDLGVRGAVVLTDGMKQLSVKGRELSVGAGLTSHAVAEAARDHALSGAEFLSWLPGSIGGACFMNAKAYGGEISKVLRRAEVVTPAGDVRGLKMIPCDFSYKTSPFQGTGDVICRATFQLRPGRAAQIGARMDEIGQSRKSKHELDHPSCGCVFKNDRSIGVPSGALIEQAGLKGYQVGDALVSPHHANFVFNTGAASSAQLRQVMEHVKRTVQERTGHVLNFEVQFIGQWD
jgi:UDP-N-acetylmuramate dehydrogenase